MDESLPNFRKEYVRRDGLPWSFSHKTFGRVFNFPFPFFFFLVVVLYSCFRVNGCLAGDGLGFFFYHVVKDEKKL